MPPPSRNQRLPAACDAPTATPASSLVSPRAISIQNSRSTSRRSDGAPGDFIGDLPVSSFIHPAGLPINTSTIKVLRRPVESAQFASWAFTGRAKAPGLVPSMGSVGDCYDNSMIESFWSRMQVELLDRRRWRTRVELANGIFDYLEISHNRRRRHSQLGMLTPIQFETQTPTIVAGESSKATPRKSGQTIRVVECYEDEDGLRQVVVMGLAAEHSCLGCGVLVAKPYDHREMVVKRTCRSGSGRCTCGG
jgi:hypothetical protein